MKIQFVIINFLILAAIIILFARKTIIGLFRGRREAILRELDEATLLDVFNGVQTYEFSISENMGARLADMLVDKMPVFPSKGEMRKLVQNNGFSINKVKITDPNAVFTEDMLLGGKYVLVQKGKKNYVLLIGA